MAKVVKNNTHSEMRETVSKANSSAKPTKHIPAQSVSPGSGMGQKIHRPGTGK